MKVADAHTMKSTSHIISTASRRPTARSKLINNYVLSQVQRFRALSTRAPTFGTASRRDADEKRRLRERKLRSLHIISRYWAQQPFPFWPLAICTAAPLCALSRFRAVLRRASHDNKLQQSVLEIPALFVIIIIISCAGSQQ